MPNVSAAGSSIGIAALLLMTAACSAPDANPLAAYAGASTVPADAGTGDDSGSPQVDVRAVFAAVANEAYQSKSNGFAQASTAFPSAAAPGKLVTEWISKDALDAFLKINPNTTGSNVTLPVGTTIVRAVQDPSTMAITKLTLLVKGPPGYNPALGDWWFAETDPSGMPLPEGDAGYQFGIPWQAENCYSCHTPRNNDDFLFGISSAYHVQESSN
ncbi:MAG TPA: hypothetical protein VE987_04800 [Polyangiaceae bacterium]|nr:hypothetical protein [Polyangiaceae bacterium]